MSSLTRNKTYTVALEWYQKDEWLFNRSKFSAEGTGLQVHHLEAEKLARHYGLKVKVLIPPCHPRRASVHPLTHQ